MLTVLPAFNPGNPGETFGWIDLEPRRSIVIAVSGGSDSTALLIAFSRWAKTAHPHLRIVCATVDHGLRPQSAGEARQVGAFCLRLGIEHRILRWTGEKPATGLPAAAREARYRLLAHAARDVGTDIILTGHTADDQAETVLMRSVRGTGRGMAGMARATLFDGGFWLLRPFLDKSRQALREMLRGEGVVWIDDPTNFDTGYERVRVRQQLADDPDRYSRLETIRLAAQARRELAQSSADLFRHGVAVAGPGLIRVEPSLLDANNAHADVWRVLLACCGGRPFPASRLDIAKLIDRLAAGRSCLSGTVAVKKRDAIYLHREIRVDGPLGFCQGIFDGRYRISPGAMAAGWRLRARHRDDPLPDGKEFDAPASLLQAALSAEPVLENADAEIGVPEPEIMRYLAPFDHFLPEFDLTLADAVAALFGRDCYPRPPVAE